MKKLELLAPAGNMDAFLAAIEAGADAIYIGGYTFGARAFANNFSDDEIIKCINYAHLYGVKVYITVNTIVYEKEVDLFLNYIDFLHRNNVDAIIIQDLGMFDLVRKVYPNLELHASTQMHIHNLNGVLNLQKWGAKRVVMARETSYETLKEIKKHTSIELEVFVHGALCVSYSGQCLMSSLIGGRSGNRGKCAGTCRQQYNLIDDNEKKYNEDSYLLSTRDLNTLEDIGKLIELGIDSFKIEGRMKRAEYVYLVVSIYRKAIDNYLKYKETRITENDILELKKIYNRKFTKGYLFNDKNIMNTYRPNHLGIKIGKVIKKDKNSIYIKLNNKLINGDGIRFLNKVEDDGLIISQMYINKQKVISAKENDVIEIKGNINCDNGATVIKTTDKEQMDKLNNLINKRTRKVSINGKVIVKQDEFMKITLNDGKNEVTFISDEKPQLATNKPLMKEDIEKQIKKINDTVYTFRNLEIYTDNKSFVTLSKLNEIRRGAIELLDQKRLYNIEYKKCSYNIDLPNFNTVNKENILIRNKDMYNKIKSKKFNELYLPDYLYNGINDDRKVLKLSRVQNENRKYDTPVLVGEIGSIIKDCYTDFSFNVVNSYTVAFLHSIGVNRVTLSQELNDEEIKELIDAYIKRYQKNPNLELIVYGREEMMISKYNILKNLNNHNNYFLMDKYKNRMPILINNDIMTIFNYNIRDKKDKFKYFDMGINYVRYEYLDEKE
mgnify:FL=1